MLDADNGYHLQSEKRARMLLEGPEMGPSYPAMVYYASQKMMTDNADALRRFIKASRESVAYMRANKAEALAVAKKVTKLPDDIANIIYDKWMPEYSDGSFDSAGIAAAKKAMTDLGRLPSVPDNITIYTDAFQK